jgi:hypothetical protein
MKVCDNADSDNRAAATNSTSLKIFLIRVQFNFCSVEVKLLENGFSETTRPLRLDRSRRFPNLSCDKSPCHSWWKDVCTPDCTLEEPFSKQAGCRLGFERRVDAAIDRTAFMAKVGSQSSEHGVRATGKHHQASCCCGVEGYVGFLCNPDAMEQDRPLPCDCNHGLVFSLLATSSCEMSSPLSKCRVSTMGSKNVVRTLDQQTS